MFDDPKKDLEYLQEQLLREEEWFQRELESAKVMIGDAPRKNTKKPQPQRTNPAPKAPVRNYANGYGEKTPAADKRETAKPRKGIGGLVALAVVETLGIVGVVAYWMLVLLK